MGLAKNKIFICYISGLDLRRINSGSTPFLFNSLNNYPWCEIKNLPSNELFPTLVTGVDPGKHGVWGVKLNHKSAGTGFFEKALEILPDSLTTTFQCTLHLLNNMFDLPAIPPNRRSRFKITRTKYKRRKIKSESLSMIGGYETIFDAAGKEFSRYLFDCSMNPEKLLSMLCNNNYDIEFLELYSLDRFQQWNLHEPGRVSNFYNVIDNFLNKLNSKCKENSIKLIIVSDHGHEFIKESINIISLLKELKLPKGSFTYFTEVSSIRFWFNSDESRNSIISLLECLNKGHLLSYKDLQDYGISLTDKSYGEIFYYLAPGLIFFPHDFNHPLANIYFSLTDVMQRSRILYPRHKGNHGHLPGCEAERSFVLLLDNNYKTNLETPDILDFAPSILYIGGLTASSSMRNNYIFKEK